MNVLTLRCIIFKGQTDLKWLQRQKATRGRRYIYVFQSSNSPTNRFIWLLSHVSLLSSFHWVSSIDWGFNLVNTHKPLQYCHFWCITRPASPWASYRLGYKVLYRTLNMEINIQSAGGKIHFLQVSQRNFLCSIWLKLVIQQEKSPKVASSTHLQPTSTHIWLYLGFNTQFEAAFAVGKII